MGIQIPWEDFENLSLVWYLSFSNKEDSNLLAWKLRAVMF